VCRLPYWNDYNNIILHFLGCESIVYFHCESGECVSLLLVCDGDADCTDASDERLCRPTLRPTFCRPIFISIDTFIYLFTYLLVRLFEIPY